MKRGVLLLVFVLLLMSLVLAQNVPDPPATPGNPDSEGSDSGQETNNSNTDTTDEQITTKPVNDDQEDQETQSETQQDVRQSPPSEDTDQTDAETTQDSSSPDQSEQESSGLILWVSVGVIALFVLGLIYFLMSRYSGPEFELTAEHKRYVKKCKRSGMSPSEIADVLSDRGYSEDAIDAMLGEY